MNSLIEPRPFRELLDRLGAFKEIEKVNDILKHQLGNRGSIKENLERLIDDINNNEVDDTFNFYPSDKTGVCHEFCLGIATRKFGHNATPDKNRTGFKGLIKNIIPYWFSCFEMNKTTIILTMDWDSEAFEKEWESIIDSYCAKGKEVLILQILEKEKAYLVKYPNQISSGQ